MRHSQSLLAFTPGSCGTRRGCLLAGVLLLALAAATSAQIGDALPPTSGPWARWSPPAVDRFAREYIVLLRQGQLEEAQFRISPEVKDIHTRQTLAQAAALLRQSEILSIEAVGIRAARTLSDQTQRYALTYQLHQARSWLLLSLALQETPKDHFEVYSIHISPLSRSLQELNAFTLKGKSIRHYGMLLLVFLIPAFILYTLVLCARTQMRRKWLWILWILFGVCRVTLDWGTGALSVSPFMMTLLGSSFFIALPPGYGPTLFSASFPLGAVWFHWKRHTRAKTSAEVSDDPARPSSRGTA